MFVAVTLERDSICNRSLRKLISHLALWYVLHPQLTHNAVFGSIQLDVYGDDVQHMAAVCAHA